MNTQSLVSRYAAAIIRWRVLVLIASVLFVAGVSSFAGKVGFDTNYRIWFEADDPYLLAHDRFLREFGNDDSFVVAFEDEQGILREAPIATVKRLTEALWQVRGVMRVDSLTNFQATRATEDGISVEDLFPEGRALDTATFKAAGEYIDREPLIIGSLLSENRKVTMIRGKFAPNAINDALPKAVYDQLKKILDAETARTGYRFHFAGGPITDEAFNQVAQADMARMMPLLLGAMILILALVFWSFWGVLIPLGVAAATIAATMGVNGLLGFKLDAVTASMPQLLLGITVATVMHLLVTFFEEKRKGEDSKNASRLALEDNLVPILLTNIATALGFASFMVGNIVPVTLLGFMACVGSVVLMVLTVTAVPALLSFHPKRVRNSPLLRFDLSTRFGRLGGWVVRHRGRVIVAWVAVTLGFAAFTPMLTVDSNPTLYFKEGYWFRDSINFMEKRGSGGAVYEIIVRGKGPESIKTVDYMRDLDKLTTYLEKEAPGEFRNVYSLSSIVRNINRSMHADDQAHHRIPGSDDEIAQYLMLYTLSLPVGQDINDRMNVDSSASRITIVRPLVSTRASRANIDAINAWAAKNLTHAKIEFTGRDVLYTNMGNNLTESLIESLGFDVLVIIPLLLLMFRSVIAGVVSVFSNVGPLIIVLGLMGAAGIMLDVGTLMVAALGLGIAVDDTVHLLAHYFKYRRKGLRAEAAAVNTMQHVGTPTAVTTVTLVCAFLVFTGADFLPNFYFGLLISIVVALALLADLTLTPALLAWIGAREDARADARAAGDVQADQTVATPTVHGTSTAHGAPAARPDTAHGTSPAPLPAFGQLAPGEAGS